MNAMKEKESRPIVLQGGRIIDGTGSEPYIGSLEIDHGKINMVCPHAEATKKAASRKNLISVVSGQGVIFNDKLFAAFLQE